jgi:general secretion pathway protein D
MKKLFIILAVLAVMSLPALADPVVYLDPSLVYFDPSYSFIPTVGGETTVNVKISDAVDMFAWQFDLSFDPTVLRVLAVYEGTFLSHVGTTTWGDPSFPDFIPSYDIDNHGGSVTGVFDSLIGPTPGASESGTLASVVFAGVAPGTSALTLANAFFVDSQGGFSSGTVQSGSVQVTPEPGSALLLGGALLALCAGLRRKLAA